MTLNVIFVCKLLENLNEQGRNARGEFRYLRGIPLQEKFAFFIKQSLIGKLCLKGKKMVELRGIEPLTS